VARRTGERAFYRWREETPEDLGSVSGDLLPELLDAKTLRAELGVTRAAAEAIMRRLPVVQIEGFRKVYVRRKDVHRYLDARTFSKSDVPS
jgi:hypothetical protein